MTSSQPAPAWRLPESSRAVIVFTPLCPHGLVPSSGPPPRLRRGLGGLPLQPQALLDRRCLLNAFQMNGAVIIPLTGPARLHETLGSYRLVPRMQRRFGWICPGRYLASALSSGSPSISEASMLANKFSLRDSHCSKNYSTEQLSVCDSE